MDDSTPLTLGVLARSGKENEHRLPIHPRHFDRIDEDVRGQIYPRVAATASTSAISDTSWRGRSAGIRSRAGADRRVRRHPAAQADAGGPRRAARRAGALGLAALRAGRRADPAGHRPAADADRLRGDEPTGARTARSTCTSSTRTTRWPATARSCTRWRSSGRRATYGRRLRAAVIGFGATARGAVTALSAIGVHDSRHPHQPQRRRGRRRRSTRREIVQFDRAETAARASCSPRTAGCRWPGSSPSTTSSSTACCRTRTRRWSSSTTPTSRRSDREPDHRRVVRRGNGFQLGQADDVRRADVHRRRQHRPTTRVDHSPSYLWNSATWEISEALMPYLGDGSRRADCVGRRRDGAASHRDPGRRHRQPGDPGLPVTGRGVSTPPGLTGQLRLKARGAGGRTRTSGPPRSRCR